MPDSERYFKCNVVGGFRLSDLNLNIKQGQYFKIDAHVVEVSRAVKAAINSKWMIEASEEEYKTNVATSRVKKTEDKPPIDSVRETGVALPNVKEVNKQLESRQADRIKEQQEEKVAVPDLLAAERQAKLRQTDTVFKDRDTVIKSPAAAIKKEATKEPVARAEADDEGVTTVKALSQEEDEEFEDLKSEVTDDLNKRIRRKRETVETKGTTE